MRNFSLQIEVESVGLDDAQFAALVSLAEDAVARAFLQVMTVRSVNVHMIQPVGSVGAPQGTPDDPTAA